MERMLRDMNAEERFHKDEDFRENVLKKMREMSAKELVERVF